MNKKEHRKNLKALIEQGILVPGAYDALSAKLVEEAGFPVVYIGSYATAASGYGLPDVGLLGLEEIVSHAKKVVDAVSIPVIADAENGFNNSVNIWRTVQAFEQVGVSGIHIEDHEFGKHADVPQELLPLDKMIKKIKAAVDAKTDPNFLIIARTDMVFALNNIEGAVERANAFTDAGADMVFLAGIDPDALKKVRHRIKGKIVTVDSKGFSFENEKSAGADVVLYYGFCIYAAYEGVVRALKILKENKDQDKALEWLANIKEFEDLIGYKDFVSRTTKYL